MTKYRRRNHPGSSPPSIDNVAPTRKPVSTAVANKYGLKTRQTKMELVNDAESQTEKEEFLAYLAVRVSPEKDMSALQFWKVCFV